jgi:hypothetical protein
MAVSMGTAHLSGLAHDARASAGLGRINEFCEGFRVHHVASSRFGRVDLSASVTRMRRGTDIHHNDRRPIATSHPTIDVTGPE